MAGATSEGERINSIHLQNLEKNCRVCGNRLKKYKDRFETSYNCKDHVVFLAETYNLSIEKDDQTIHPSKFCQRFELNEIRKDDFYCPICCELLDKPVETIFTHNACGACLTQALAVNSSCPVCKTILSSGDDIKKFNHTLLGLIESQIYKCKGCGKEVQYQHCGEHECRPSEGSAPPNVAQQQPSQTISEALKALRDGKMNREVAELGTAVVRELLKRSADKTVSLPCRGKKVGGRLSAGGEMDTLVIHQLRQKEKKEREAVLKKALGKELILQIPEGEALAMKADLRLPWFALGKLTRWFSNWILSTFCSQSPRISKPFATESLRSARLSVQNYLARQELSRQNSNSCSAYSVFATSSTILRPRCPKNSYQFWVNTN
ncbi:predicted protein [Nematostella vectensis]|uniref:RING-type domain-containing protein n=1 Tax=Nematostella vectensis TaxID=45351 RepID=A7RVN1_NEMVE|nr:predicted protein [Nematostella vectensis]|eukprot:XP_001636477.1 predicted protein [Nematostella vectensis]